MPSKCLKRIILHFPAFQTATFSGALQGPEVEESYVL